VNRGAALVALVVLAAAGCSGGVDESTNGQPLADTVALLPPYEAVPLDVVGRIEGTVIWDGPTPAATTVRLADSLARVCRASSLRLTSVRVVRGGVMESVVWLDGIRRGKALPASRRFEVATDRCRLTPAVQPAIAGGILNVLSLDRLVHRLQFTRAGTEGTVGRVEQFDEGQVVPLETILRLPGPVSVRSDRFSWMEASIHVFDHPYFAMTEAGGAFMIDSVPPGEHTLVVWHPVTGQRDTTVSVGGGDTVQVRLVIGANEA
jgi:hypothetical protein